MEIKLNNHDLQQLAESRKFKFAFTFGSVVLHSFTYKNSKIVFLLDYPFGDNVEVELDSFSLEDQVLNCKIDLKGILAGALIKLVNKFIKTPIEGCNIDYPSLKYDLSKLNIPIVPEEIEATDDGINITGRLKKL